MATRFLSCLPFISCLTRCPLPTRSVDHRLAGKGKSLHHQRRIMLIMATVGSLLGAALPGWAATQQALSIGSYTLVRSQRVIRTQYDYTYKAQITNLGSTGLQHVIATAISTSPKTVIIEGKLHFGTVAAGAMVTSRDTFIIRQDGSVPFNPAVLVWSIKANGIPVPVIVPDVAGLPQAQAEAILTDAQLQVGTVTTETSTTVAEGNVISQTPTAGTSVAPGSTVNLVVSSGPPPGGEFSLALSSSSLSIHQDAKAGVLVTLTRLGGFTGEVSVTVSDAPAGITAETVTFPEGWTEGALVLKASPTAQIGGPLVLTVTGTSGTSQQSLPLNLTVLTAAPRAQTLIAAAREAGQIDYGTSLLYRVYALFGDPRLPLELQGSGSAEEDPSLFFEIEQAEATLPADIRTLLRPFVVRPTNPDSIFNQAPAPTAPLSLHVMEARAVTEAATTPCATQSPPGWTSRRHPQYPVRVWAQCSSETDTTADTVIQKTLEKVSKLWQDETGLMGDPVPDCPVEDGTCPTDHGPDADGAIDFYVLPPDVPLVRDGGPVNIGLVSARERSSPPYRGVTSSGYVLLNRDRITTSGFYSNMVHEFFHVLQDAHNQKISFRTPGSEEWDEYWFVEASATWAQAYFAKDTARAMVHSRFPSQCEPSFQRNRYSLNDSVPVVDSDSCESRGVHMYAAYIWPFFMQQEVGPRAIAEAWEALELVAKDDWDGALKAIDSALPFATTFRTFALRNFNTGFPPEADPAKQQNPLGKRYKDLDDQFFDGAMPALETEDPEIFEVASDAQEPGAPFFMELPALKAEYYHLQATPNEVHSWELDFSGMDTPSTFGVDAVVHSIKDNEDKWEVRHLSPLPPDKKVTLCEVDRIYLVLSNAAQEDRPANNSKKVTGVFKVKALSAPCTCGDVAQVAQWQGTLAINYNAADNNNEVDVAVNAQANLKVTLEPDTSVHLPLVAWIGRTPPSEEEPLPGEGKVTGPVSYNGRTTTTGPSGNTVYTVSGAGPAVEGSELRLTVDLNTCKYVLEGGGLVEVEIAVDGEHIEDTIHSLTVRSAPRVLPDGNFLKDAPTAMALKDQGPFRVDLLASADTDFFIFADGWARGALLGVLKNNSTTANVSWTLEPVPPPSE